MHQPTNILPDLSNQQTLGEACASAILAELGGRYGQPGQPLAPEVLAVLDQLRAVLGRCTMLDSPRKPAPIMRMVIDESMPKTEPMADGVLHPIHIQTIENLVRQVSELRGAHLEHIQQQAESVGNMMNRLKGRRLQGPAEPATGTEAGSNDKHPLTVLFWRDSRQPVTEWCFLKSLPAFSVVEARTVGFVIHEDEHTIAIAPTLACHGQPDAQVMGIVQIPKASVHLRLLLGVMPHSEP